MTRRSHRTPRLLRDDRGAIMLIGLVMAVFMVALVYHVIGIGDALLHRERMQDAADAAAFSSAVMHARGMNLIVLINLIMAAMLAVLVALKLAETVVSVAIVILVGLAYFSGGSTLKPAADLVPVRQRIRALHAALKPPIDAGLVALSKTAKGVKVVVPWTAQVRVIDTVVNHYAPPARIGFAIPSRLTLPTQDDEYSRLCGKAGELAADLITLPIDVVSGADAAGDAISSVVSQLTESGSGWFCGDGGFKPPSATFRRDVVYPELPAQRRCLAEEMDDSPDSVFTESAACDQAIRDWRASEPHGRTGNCGTGHNGRLCELRAAMARDACNPQDHPNRKGYMWQQREVKRRYVRRAGTWTLVSEEPGDPKLVTQDMNSKWHPCGSDRAKYSAEWHGFPDGYRANDGPVPLCTYRPKWPSRPRAGNVHRATEIEVLNVFRCGERIVEKRQVSEVTKDPAMDGLRGKPTNKNPQKLSDDVTLGSEDLQLRAIVIGGQPPGLSERIIELSTWGNKPKNSVLSKARRLAALSVAQAEYYYQVENPGHAKRGEWLWKMRWRARLRRFHLPEEERQIDPAGGEGSWLNVPEAPTSFLNACEAVGADDCGSRRDELLDLQSLIVH